MKDTVVLNYKTLTQSLNQSLLKYLKVASLNYLMATFADGTAILTTKKSAKDSNEALQTALDSINTWTKKWRIKLNHQKSVHVHV